MDFLSDAQQLAFRRWKLLAVLAAGTEQPNSVYPERRANGSHSC